MFFGANIYPNYAVFTREFWIVFTKAKENEIPILADVYNKADLSKLQF